MSFQSNSNNEKQGSWKKVEGQKKGVAELFDCHFVLADNNIKFKGYES